LNKENSVDSFLNKIPVVFDTGAKYNLISNSGVIKPKLNTHKKAKTMKFWTCLEEPFEIKKYTFM